MATDLPANVRRDLDRAAKGIGRIATAAHPDCACPKTCTQHDGQGDERDVFTEEARRRAKGKTTEDA